MELHVAGLWRYPVKSMAGEPLTSAEVTTDGIPGDRLVHVRGPEGLRTARRHHRLLGLKGTLEPGRTRTRQRSAVGQRRRSGPGEGSCGRRRVAGGL